MKCQNASKRQIGIRITADAILLVCVYIAPFWFIAILAIIFAFYFTGYYEIIFFGIVADALYLPDFSHIPLMSVTLAAIIAYMIVLFIKPRLRVYSRSV